jgi:hypothetical protein
MSARSSELCSSSGMKTARLAAGMALAMARGRMEGWGGAGAGAGGRLCQLLPRQANGVLADLVDAR